MITIHKHINMAIYNIYTSTYKVKHGCYCYCKCISMQLVGWNVTQHSPWFVAPSPVVSAWQMEKLSDGGDQRPLKHNKPLEHVAFGLSINTSLVLYLSFALIRQKISEQVSCNTEDRSSLYLVGNHFRISSSYSPS